MLSLEPPKNQQGEGFTSRPSCDYSLRHGNPSLSLCCECVQTRTSTLSTTGLENWTLFSGVEIQPFDWCSSLRPHGLNLRTGKAATGACVEHTAKRITPMMSRAMAGENSRFGRCADDGEMDRRHVPQTRPDASYLSADMLPRKDGQLAGHQPVATLIYC
ncbi:hypothetical protein V8C34DRAFT_291910 [Trichoderma compactum]